MKKIQVLNFVAALALLLALDVVITNRAVAGGDKYSPRLVGMGRAFTAFSRGLDAVGVNPANLALNDRNATVTINLAPTGLSLGSDFINLQIYNDFFTGDPTRGKNPATGKLYPKTLTENDKDKILELFPSGIGRTQLNLQTAPIGLSLQIGNFGFAIVPSIQTTINLDLDKEYLEFPLRGYPADKAYNFNNTAINGQSVAEINTSLAYQLPFELRLVSNIAVGVGVKYLHGLAFIATDHYKGSITPYTSEYQGVRTNDSTRAKFDFLQWIARVDEKNPTQPAGKGIGYDVGVSMRLFENIQFGASITDIGKIKWDKNTKAIIGNADVTVGPIIGDTASQSKLKNAFKGQTIDTTGFEFDLPTALNVGFAVQLDDVMEWLPFRWLVAVDGHFGLNEIGGNTKLPQFSIGTELDPIAGWFPLRTGIMIGGRERFAWSAGFGIHILNTFDLDFATQSLAIITNPNTFRTGSFTMGMRLRF